MTRSSPRAIRNRRSFRSISPRHPPTTSATSPARFARSSDGSTDSCTRRRSWARSGPIEHQSFDAWQKVLRVNLAAAMALTRSTLPLLSAAPDACVVFTLDARGERSARLLGRVRRRQGRDSRRSRPFSRTSGKTGPTCASNAVVPGPMRSPLRALTHPGEDRSALPLPDALVPLYLHLARPRRPRRRAAC